MQAQHADKIRSRLRGKPLGLFDMLADGALVDTETLFEALNSQEGDFGAAAMDERIRRYAAQLNLQLAQHGLRVSQVDDCGYIIGKTVMARPAAREEGRMVFFEKKNQKSFASSRTSAG